MTKEWQALRMLSLAVILCAPVAISQDRRIDVVTSKRDETESGPGMLCEDAKKPTVSTGRHLSLSIGLMDKQTYKVGEKAIFELTIRNSGIETVLIPAQACSEKSALANQPGVMEACINLDYTTPGGEHDWLTGPCLCGREDSKNLNELKTGESIVVRGDPEIVLGPELFPATYNAEKPTLILAADLSVSREHFPIQEGSKAIDG
jgi:hypothetical protein